MARRIGGDAIPSLVTLAAIVAIVAASVGGWLTHIIHCIHSQEWFLLIAGAIAAPVGIIHGWGLWFNWW